MIQQYQATTFKGTAKEKTAVLVEVAHLLNKLRYLADDSDTPLTNAEETTFWKLISILPRDAQSSVIN